MTIRLLSALMAGLLLAGCASVPDGRGRPQAETLARERGLEAPSAEKGAEIASDLLSTPLTAQDAARIALVRNADLRGAYARLGLAAADIYEAGRLSNPVLSASRLDSDEPGALDQVTFGLAQSFTDLLLLADRSDLAEREFARAQAQVAARVFEIATETADAWHELAVRMETAKVMSAAADAADAAAELAGRFFQAGNMTRLELAELQAEAGEARIAAINARAAVDAARAELGTLMGVDAATEWSVAEGLPAPAASPDFKRLKRAAADSRLDLLAARRRVAVYENALGVTRQWRWLGEVEVEAETERETDGSRLTGLGIALEWPVFDQHEDDVVRAESRLEAAYAERDRLATTATHEIKLARARLAAARQRETALGEGVLPERRRQVEETQKQVNFMLMGVFELIETRRREYRAIAEYLESVGEYWHAHVALERAVGRLIDAPADGRRIHAEALMKIESNMAGMQHGMEGGMAPMTRPSSPDEDEDGHGSPHAHHHGGDQ